MLDDRDDRERPQNRERISDHVIQERTDCRRMIRDKLSDFVGLSRRSPLLAGCMMIFMLSLAGIPPLAGFFGKFYVFADALRYGARDLGLLWLVILAIGTSAISLYYYLQVLKQIYVAKSLDEAQKIHIAIPVQVAIVVLAAAVLLLGCLPNLLVGKLLAILQLAGM